MESIDERNLATRVDQAIDQAIGEGRIIGAVVLVSRGDTCLYRRAAGHADRETGRLMREDAILRLASVTKSLVSAAAMRLVEEGKISLADPVTRWLPEFQPATHDGRRPAISLHQLLTHTSGLSYGFLEPLDHVYQRLGVSDGMDDVGLTLDENLERLAAAPLAFEPGASWRYSLSIDVLGAVMERATEMSLADIVASRITQPLNMVDTVFGVVDAQRLATAYVNASPTAQRMAQETLEPIGPGVVRFAPGRILNARAYASGGTGMSGTADDVLLFFEAIRRGGWPILSEASVDQMLRDQVGPEAQAQGPGWGFGYGWAVLVDSAPTRTPQGRGSIQWGGAYGCSWFVDPEARLTVVALTNTALEGMSGRFPLDVRNAVYGIDDER